MSYRITVVSSYAALRRERFFTNRGLEEAVDLYPMVVVASSHGMSMGSWLSPETSGLTATLTSPKAVGST